MFDRTFLRVKKKKMVCANVTTHPISSIAYLLFVFDNLLPQNTIVA